MKKINSLLVLIGLLFGAVSYGQMCQIGISFTNGTSLGEIIINDSSTNTSSASFTSSYASPYLVNLTPGGTASVTFPSNGTYNYYYSIYDSITGCIDSVFNTLTVTNGAASPCLSLQGDLIVSAGTNPGEYIFTDNTPNINTGVLDVSSGQLSNQYILSPSYISTPHTFPSNGTYAYNYVVSYSTGCSDTIVDSILVTGINTPQNCSSDFSLILNPTMNNQYYGWNSSVNGVGNASGLTYFWDFGNGYTSTLAYPMSTYLSNGYFNVCLTITDTVNQCSDTHCESIFISSNFTGSATTLMVLPPGANLGTEELETWHDLNLYPNPTNNDFSITLASVNNSNAQVLVTSLTGQNVQSLMTSIVKGDNTINVSMDGVENGIYLVSIINQSSDTKKTFRMTKK